MLMSGSSWRPLMFKALLVEAAQFRGISFSKAIAQWLCVAAGDSNSGLLASGSEPSNPADISFISEAWVQPGSSAHMEDGRARS